MTSSSAATSLWWAIAMWNLGISYLPKISPYRVHPSPSVSPLSVDVENVSVMGVGQPQLKFANENPCLLIFYRLLGLSRLSCPQTFPNLHCQSGGQSIVVWLSITCCWEESSRVKNSILFYSDIWHFTLNSVISRCYKHVGASQVSIACNVTCCI